ncbi:pre-mRNA splicing factor [Naematelia encephala]|uniref:Pre-mRNA splicing factor n=1 Tax=Naematelia encephala TaxID=71784 RepID=A0A1Y2AKV4_9TREE|nr:pre-mRNA splicing factor [Naematelia encephala]
MATLSLPKPVNTYAGEDELRPKTNGTPVNGAELNGNGEEEEWRPPRPSDRFKKGIIYPPKEIRNIVDKTASHISKSPTPLLLEEKIREFQKTDPKFAFLNDADPYHQYYRYMIEKIKEDAEDAATRGASATPAPAPEAVKPASKEEDQSTYEPKAWEFKVDLPGVTAMDLDILRLTALFHARRGRSFLSSLSLREGRNYQFDFLRPTHSLFGYYNRMVESYQKVIQPPPGMIEHLIKDHSDPKIKWKTLEEARNRADWEKGRKKRNDEQAKEKEEEAKAMAQIDWQDFVVVETIEFTQNDMELDLPPPTSVDKLQSMSMAERRMASMVMEETGAGPTGAGVQPMTAMEEEMEMEEEEEEEVRLQRIKAEQEQARAREVQRAAMESRGVKIKKDYVPKGIQRTGAVATAKCPYCGQSIPENELSEHIRIELLDPKWKEQKRQLDQRRAQHNQLTQGADVSGSLRNLAQARTDLFGDEIDEVERKRREEEEKQKRREREKIIWDGHTASAAKTADTFQTQFSLEDQIKKMHSRMGLTGDAEQSRVGPQAGPGIQPQPLPPPMAAGLPTPGGGTAYSGATISAAPTGPSTREYISAPYDPTFAPSASGPSVHPSRAGQVAPPPPPVVPQSRPAPDDDDDAPPERPVFKRPKVDKLPYGQLYTDVDWMSLHPDPVAISVQLPSMPDKPEWKLDGSIITVPDLPVNTLFSTIRERIKRVVDADLPVSKIKLDYNGKTMNNGHTMASVNLDDGDVIVMSMRK